MTYISGLGGTHGNEGLGPAVCEMFEQRPVPGIRTHIAHPEAVAAGVRYLGDSSQLMDHYPGNAASDDPQDRAAAGTMEWLGDDAGSERAVVHDIHNSDLYGNFFCMVGNRALKAALGSAILLGHRRILSSQDSFFAAVPNAVALEHPIVTSAEEKATTRYLHRGLSGIAELDPTELQNYYARNVSKLSFWSKLEVLIVPGSYTNRVQVIEDPDLLTRLEAIPGQHAMTELVLEDDLRDALRIRRNAKVLTECWGYKNMSRDHPELGEFDGRPKKLVLGSLLEEIEPPVDDGDWVVFK